jgi:hypothetical protein
MGSVQSGRRQFAAGRRAPRSELGRPQRPSLRAQLDAMLPVFLRWLVVQEGFAAQAPE